MEDTNIGLFVLNVFVSIADRREACKGEERGMRFVGSQGPQNYQIKVVLVGRLQHEESNHNNIAHEIMFCPTCTNNNLLLIRYIS